MGTTMLERANPLNDLRPAPQANGRTRRILAELDTEVTQIFQALEPAPERRALPPARRGDLAAIKPAPTVGVARRADPRQQVYPVTANLATPRPRHRFMPRISVMRVAQSGPAVATEMPRTLTWLPMLRGHQSVNAEHDKIWRQWLSGWDRTIVIGYRLARARLVALRIEERVRHQEIAAKLRRITDYHTRAVWQDYLDAFGALDGLDNTCAHVLGELDRLETLSLT